MPTTMAATSSVYLVEDATHSKDCAWDLMAREDLEIAYLGQPDCCIEDGGNRADLLLEDLVEDGRYPTSSESPSHPVVPSCTRDLPR